MVSQNKDEEKQVLRYRAIVRMRPLTDQCGGGFLALRFASPLCFGCASFMRLAPPKRWLNSVALRKWPGAKIAMPCNAMRQMPLVKKAKTEKDEDIEPGQEPTLARAFLDANAKECLGWKSTDQTELKMLRSRRDILPVDRIWMLSIFAQHMAQQRNCESCC